MKSVKVKWRKNERLKPQVLMDKLKAITKVDPAGKVSYKAFEKHEIDSVIMTMIEFDREFSYPSAKKIYLDAQGVCAKNKVFTKEGFLLELNAAVVRHIAKKEEKYVMVTSVSIAGGFASAVIKTSKASIRCFPSGLPTKYRTRNSHAWSSDLEAMPTEYCPVSVTVSSKDKMDAFHAAIYELDYVRGLHALLLNPHAEFHFGSSARGSLNRVMLGGLHSLHNGKGKLIDKNLYWHEKNYKVRKPVKPKNSVQLNRHVKLVLVKVAAHKNGFQIKSAIVRYLRAYDEVDKNVVIQKLWSAIESLVSPGENNAESIVRRCSFMFDERPYHAQILEHLREYRNSNVHNGHEVEDLDYHCFQLQMFFREAVFFYLGNYKIFPTLQMANKFLDLPSGLEELRHLKMSVEKALRYQRYYDPVDEATS